MNIRFSISKNYLFTTCVIFIIVVLIACSNDSGNYKREVDIDRSIVSEKIKLLDTLNLKFIYPNFSRIDLLCGEEPKKSDSSVILFAEAAYTGKCLKNFNHKNIAGDHVSKGVRYKGYPCKRNTGAFIFYKGKWHFRYKSYSKELDAAAQNGGAAFAQELLIYSGHIVQSARPDNIVNQYRALCEHNHMLCIVKSKDKLTLGEFKENLLQLGVTNAIYLDMGSGWNYAWYRKGEKIIELHPKTHNFCTNWITFYK